jgi:hypothetical protein
MKHLSLPVRRRFPHPCYFYSVINVHRCGSVSTLVYKIIFTIYNVYISFKVLNSAHGAFALFVIREEKRDVRE